jgi:CRISPR-associated endonuclease/helicase Cas3
LSIHPFPDFNGRVTRLFLTELLRRLDLPAVELAPVSAENRKRFLEALHAADKLNWRPLIALWKERIETAP